jgi:hypothetical protein
MFHCLNHAAAKATKAAMPRNILPVVSLFIPHPLDSQWVLTDQETSQRLPVLRVDHEIQVVSQHHCDFSGSLVFQRLTSVVKEIETRRVLDCGVQKLHGRRVHSLSESRARLQGQSRKRGKRDREQKFAESAMEVHPVPLLSCAKQEERVFESCTGIMTRCETDKVAEVSNSQNESAVTYWNQSKFNQSSDSRMWLCSSIF